MKRSTTLLRACRADNRAPWFSSFMAHHQGMSFLSLAYLLLDRPMQKRFESEPSVPGDHAAASGAGPQGYCILCAHYRAFRVDTRLPVGAETPVRVFSSPDTPVPEVQLLSNGRYHVMITNAGGGYSRWKDIAVTRWREDSTCDNWGTFCYIRDVTSGRFWSTTYQPTLERSKNFEAIFSEGRAEFRCRDDDFDTYTEIVVSPEDDIELRRIAITNRSRTRRDDRRDELCGSGPGAARRGRTASGVQQSLCSNRDHPAAAGDSLHSPAPLHRRAGAMDVSPDGRAWGRKSERFLTRPIGCSLSAEETLSPIRKR